MHFIDLIVNNYYMLHYLLLKMS